MFTTPTVIVIGAGAGADIDMPVGSTLSQIIANKLDIRFEDNKQKGGDPLLADAIKKAAKLRNQDFNAWRRTGCTVSAGIEYTRSIDAYINTHRDNEKIKVCAKLAIAQTILEHERRSAIFVKEGAERQFTDRKKIMTSWLPDFLYILQDRIVVSENLGDIFKNLCVISFNYDRCLEQFLFHAICDLYQKSHIEVAALMLTLKIFRPYGCVGYMPWHDNKRRVDFGVTDYGDLLGLSEEIRTFNEQIEDGDELRAMRDTLAHAKRIIFLGFHYHQQNMDLLKTPSPMGERIIDVYGTALQRSASDTQIIRSQIREILPDRGNKLTDSIVGTDCKGLFREYGTTFLK